MAKAKTKVTIEMKANGRAAAIRLTQFRPHTGGNKKKLASKTACRGKTTRFGV